MHARRSSTTVAQDRLLHLIADATAELMRNLDEIEHRLDRLEQTIRARVARSERASTLH